jgi:hypothetical protein
MNILSYEEIQTAIPVWTELLKLNPIEPNSTFLEPFKGKGSLYNQIETNKKYYCEIEEKKNIFDFEHKDEITCIITNPPFKALIPNKKGEMVYKNAIFFFLDYFTLNYKNLNTLGFLINATGFNALTPYRLTKLAKQGFTISAITILNTNWWYGTYYYLIFRKDYNNKTDIHIIPKTFIK